MTSGANYSFAAAVRTAQAGQDENEPYEVTAAHTAAATRIATATTTTAVQDEQEKDDVAAAASATTTVIATVCKKVHSMYLRLILGFLLHYLTLIQKNVFLSIENRMCKYTLIWST